MPLQIWPRAISSIILVAAVTFMAGLFWCQYCIFSINILLNAKQFRSELAMGILKTFDFFIAILGQYTYDTTTTTQDNKMILIVAFVLLSTFNLGLTVYSVEDAIIVFATKNSTTPFEQIHLYEASATCAVLQAVLTLIVFALTAWTVVCLVRTTVGPPGPPAPPAPPADEEVPAAQPQQDAAAAQAGPTQPQPSTDGAGPKEAKGKEGDDVPAGNTHGLLGLDKLITRTDSHTDKQQRRTRNQDTVGGYHAHCLTFWTNWMRWL